MKATKLAMVLQKWCVVVIYWTTDILWSYQENRFVFPRVKFYNQMLRGGPPGVIGLAKSPKSASITGSLLIKVLQHIQKHTKCSKEEPIPTLMDNHDSHCSLEAVICAKLNGVVLVTFLLHCTHRMQPLDVAIISPFNPKYSFAQND